MPEAAREQQGGGRGAVRRRGDPLHDPRVASAALGGPSGGVAAAQACVRERVPTLTEDRELGPDMRAVEGLLADGSLTAAATAAVGPLA